MFNAFKSKIWIFLTSPRIGKLIIKYFTKDGFIKTTAGLVKVGSFPTMPISLIFWGLYEREDIKFINKYLSAVTPVIEFGASLGVTTSHICKKVKSDTPVISIEANPNLYVNLLETKKINRLDNLVIISAAIDYSGTENVGFSVDESTLSSSKNSKNLNVIVPAIKLSDIIKKHCFQEYSLVCDIEGAEIELILMENNLDAIKCCNLIIIELHQTTFEKKTYSIEELLMMLANKFLMKVIDQDERTFVLSK